MSGTAWEAGEKNRKVKQKDSFNSQRQYSRHMLSFVMQTLMYSCHCIFNVVDAASMAVIVVVVTVPQGDSGSVRGIWDASYGGGSQKLS